MPDVPQEAETSTPAGGPAGGRSPHELTPELITDLWRPVEVRLSPDGGRVAWTAQRSGSDDDRDETAVWVADVAGDGAGRRWTWGRGDRAARWSPDGRMIAFLSDRVVRGRHDLYLLDAGGGEARPLFCARRGIRHFAWAPTGTQLAVVVEEDPSAEEAAEEHTDDAIEMGHDRPARLWLVDAETGDRRGPLPVDGHVVEAAWSPDGGTLGVVVAPGAEMDDIGRREVMTVPVAGGPCTVICPAPWSEGLCWAAGRLVWAGYHEANPVSAATVWSVEPTAGAEPEVVGPAVADPTCALAVLQDGRNGAVALNLTGLDTALRTVDPTGAGRATLVWEADGDVSAIDVARPADSGLVMAAATSPACGHREVWAGGPGRMRRVSDHGAVLAGVGLGAVHALEFVGSDGRPYDGMLVLPPGRGLDDGPRPMVVSPHGGPYGHSGRSLHLGPLDWAQWLAADGIAVLMPNYRGSAGRGQAGAAAVRGDLGGAEWGDVLTAVDAMVERGVADPDRLGIGGWSQGGFLSAWAVTRTDRFRAAVVGAGVTDWAMLAVTSDLPTFEAALAGDGPPWDPDQRRRSDAQSPLAAVDRVTTPTLLLHGERDLRVPVSQARAFWLGLRAHGVPTELVVYPGEPHAVGQRRHQHDILRRVRQWYRTWLLAPRPDAASGP